MSGKASNEPFSAVETDLDLEREPGLQADVEPAEGWVHVVVVQVRALARLGADGAGAGGSGRPVERPARLHALQHADQPALDVSRGGERARLAPCPTCWS